MQPNCSITSYDNLHGNKKITSEQYFIVDVYTCTTSSSEKYFMVTTSDITLRVMLSSLHAGTVLGHYIIPDAVAT